MTQPTITGQIYSKAIELLDTHPEGIHWSDLIKQIQNTYPQFHPKTINGCIWKLVEKYPEKIYKPEKGLFKSIKYKA